jgi:hypothetical protein
MTPNKGLVLFLHHSVKDIFILQPLGFFVPPVGQYILFSTEQGGVDLVIGLGDPSGYASQPAIRPLSRKLDYPFVEVADIFQV